MHSVCFLPVSVICRTMQIRPLLLIPFTIKALTIYNVSELSHLAFH